MGAAEEFSIAEARTGVTLAPATVSSFGAGDDHPSSHHSANRVLTLVDGNRTRVRHVRAWMLVLPVDAALLMLPVVWHPQHLRGSIVMATLFLLLLSSAGRYRGNAFRCRPAPMPPTRRR